MDRMAYMYCRSQRLALPTFKGAFSIKKIHTFRESCHFIGRQRHDIILMNFTSTVTYNLDPFECTKNITTLHSTLFDWNLIIRCVLNLLHLKVNKRAYVCVIGDIRYVTLDP